jgi:ATP-dependent DNA ligase
VDLAGPIDVELTHSVETVPRAAKPGSLAFEPKYDGFRATISRAGDEVRIWSRKGTDLTGGFPEISAAAVHQLPAGVCLDGELVVSVDGRMTFKALLQRLRTSPAAIRQLVAATPASSVAFDLLAYGGVDLRTQRWTTRRARLEQLAAAWWPPLELTMVTYDVDEALEWFDVLPAAHGIEGLVIKPTSARYVGGRRTAWAKVNSIGVGGVRLLACALMGLVRCWIVVVRT